MALHDVPPCAQPRPLAPLSSAHERLARRLSRRYRSPSFDRDDLAQEARVVILWSLPEYDPARHGPSPDAFLYHRVTSRLNRLCCIDRARSTSHTAAPADDLVDDRPGPEELATRADLFAAAREHLTPPQGRVLELTAAGWQDEDIAAELVVSLGAVWSLRSRGIATLRDLVA
jgi:RNA polymerase sigma factor (sigma-70 family)